MGAGQGVAGKAGVDVTVTGFVRFFMSVTKQRPKATFTSIGKSISKPSNAYMKNKKLTPSGYSTGIDSPSVTFPSSEICH